MTHQINERLASFAGLLWRLAGFVAKLARYLVPRIRYHLKPLVAPPSPYAHRQENPFRRQVERLDYYLGERQCHEPRKDRDEDAPR